MEWLQTILRHVRQGRHAFIITGNIGDGFPHERGADPDGLVAWYDIVASVLRSGRPDYLCWTFDPARGFLFSDGADEQTFIDLVKEKEKEEDGKKGDEEDTLRDLRRQMDGMDEGLPASFVQAMPVTLRAFTESATKEVDKRRPCVALVHDADSAWNGQSSDERVTRAFLAMQRIAESDGYRRAGHILMVATPSVTSLPERFRRADSPFTIIRITRPSHEERVRYLESIVVTESLRERLEELRQARRRREQEAAERLDANIVAAAADVDHQTEADIEDDELRSADAAVRLAEQALAKSSAQWEAGNEERAAKLLAVKEALAAAPPERPLSKETIKTVRVGDIVEYRVAGKAIKTQRKTVLQADDGNLHLSTVHDATQVTSHPDDEKPIVYYWDADGFAQRRSSAKKGKAQTLPEGVSLIVVPKMRHELLAEKAGLERVIAEFLNEKTRDSKLVDQLDAARKVSDTLRTTRSTEKRKRVETARAHLEHLRAVKAMGKTGAEQDTEADRMERELSAGRFPPPACGLSEMARYSQGLGYRDIVGMFRAAQQDGRECDALTVLAERHNALARSYGHLVDIVKPAYGFEGIAGLDGIKRFFKHVRDDIAKGMLARVPMGCLLMGPPGTGKTAIAEAFAEECGFLFVKIRNVRSMWVGETERQMEDLIAGLRELAPVVVLRDEVDQEDTGRDSFQGDSGVSARVRQKWMEFLSDPAIRGRVFVISCSNRPDLLDAALKRSGRTDERIPVLMPDAETRKRLFPVMLKRVQGNLPGIVIEGRFDKEDLKRLAAMTENLSGADIEVIVRHAVEYADVEDGKVIVDAKCLERAAKDFIPSDSTMQIAKMTLSAIGSCARREFLPKDAKEIVKRCLTNLGFVVKEAKKPEDDTLETLLAQHKPEKGPAN